MQCPKCEGYDFVKNGTYKTNYGYIQKFYCKACEYHYIYNEVKGDKKPELNALVVELSDQGYSRRAIAEELGISKRTVDKKLKKYAKLKSKMGRPKKKKTVKDVRKEHEDKK